MGKNIKLLLRTICAAQAILFALVISLSNVSAEDRVPSDKTCSGKTSFSISSLDRRLIAIAPGAQCLIKLTETLTNAFTAESMSSQPIDLLASKNSSPFALEFDKTRQLLRISARANKGQSTKTVSVLFSGIDGEPLAAVGLVIASNKISRVLISEEARLKASAGLVAKVQESLALLLSKRSVRKAVSSKNPIAKPLSTESLKKALRQLNRNLIDLYEPNSAETLSGKLLLGYLKQSSENALKALDRNENVSDRVLLTFAQFIDSIDKEIAAGLKRIQESGRKVPTPVATVEPSPTTLSTPQSSPSNTQVPVASATPTLAITATSTSTATVSPQPSATNSATTPTAVSTTVQATPTQQTNPPTSVPSPVASTVPSVPAGNTPVTQPSPTSGQSTATPAASATQAVPTATPQVGQERCILNHSCETLSGESGVCLMLAEFDPHRGPRCVAIGECAEGGKKVRLEANVGQGSEVEGEYCWYFSKPRKEVETAMDFEPSESCYDVCAKKRGSPDWPKPLNVTQLFLSDLSIVRGSKKTRAKFNCERVIAELLSDYSPDVTKGDGSYSCAYKPSDQTAMLGSASSESAEPPLGHQLACGCMQIDPAKVDPPARCSSIGQSCGDSVACCHASQAYGDIQCKASNPSSSAKSCCIEPSGIFNLVTKCSSHEDCCGNSYCGYFGSCINGCPCSLTISPEVGSKDQCSGTEYTISANSCAHPFGQKCYLDFGDGQGITLTDVLQRRSLNGGLLEFTTALQVPVRFAPDLHKEIKMICSVPDAPLWKRPLCSKSLTINTAPLGSASVCVARYQEFEDCKWITDRQECNNKIIDGAANCSYNASIGQCMSSMQLQAIKWLEKNSCDYQVISSMHERMTDALGRIGAGANTVKSIKYGEFTHSSASRVMDYITDVFGFLPRWFCNADTIEAASEGCGTFGSKPEAREAVARVLDVLKPRLISGSIYGAQANVLAYFYTFPTSNNVIVSNPWWKFTFANNEITSESAVPCDSNLKCSPLIANQHHLCQSDTGFSRATCCCPDPNNQASCRFFSQDELYSNPSQPIVGPNGEFLGCQYAPMPTATPSP